MNPPNTVINPYTSCTPTYNSNGQINCPSNSGCQTGPCTSQLPVQYTLCPYNPYLSDGKKCVTTCKETPCQPCTTPCCPEGYSCNANNVNCVDGCYTTNVSVDWIAPLIFYKGLTDPIPADDFNMVLNFQTVNNDDCVTSNECPSTTCGSVTTDVNRRCLPTGGSCCCYPTPNKSTDVPKIILRDLNGGVSGSLNPVIVDPDGTVTDNPETLPIQKTIITPLNPCCPNPCTDTINVQIIVQLNGAIVGVSDPLGNLPPNQGTVDISLTLGSFFVDNVRGTLTLYYTYTCVCNEPTWTIYNGELSFTTPP